MAATGKHAPWRLWILIVIWVFQLLFLLASAGIYVIAMVALFRTITYTDSSGNRTTYTATTAFRIGTIVQLILIVLSLILTLVEIVKCGRLRLSPKYYLVSNVIKTIIWVGLCIASLVVVNYDGTKNAGTIVVSIIMMLLFIIPMIYAAIVFHKNKHARGTYAGVNNPNVYSGPGDNTGYKADAVPLTNTTYGVPAPQQPYNAQSYYGHDTGAYAGGNQHQQYSNV